MSTLNAFCDAIARHHMAPAGMQAVYKLIIESYCRKHNLPRYTKRSGTVREMSNFEAAAASWRFITLILPAALRQHTATRPDQSADVTNPGANLLALERDLATQTEMIAMEVLQAVLFKPFVAVASVSVLGEIFTVVDSLMEIVESMEKAARAEESGKSVAAVPCLEFFLRLDKGNMLGPFGPVSMAPATTSAAAANTALDEESPAPEQANALVRQVAGHLGWQDPQHAASFFHARRIRAGRAENKNMAHADAAANSEHGLMRAVLRHAVNADNGVRRRVQPELAPSDLPELPHELRVGCAADDWELTLWMVLLSLKHMILGIAGKLRHAFADYMPGGKLRGHPYAACMLILIVNDICESMFGLMKCESRKRPAAACFQVIDRRILRTNGFFGFYMACRKHDQLYIPHSMLDAAKQVRLLPTRLHTW